MEKKIYGLVGPPQSGKTKINDLFTEKGIEFINLNTAGNRIRAVDSPIRNFFDEIVPGKIFDNGIRRPSYYIDICRNPKKLETIMTVEIPVIEEYARQQIATATTDIILSWEYLHLLSPEFKFDEIILLICGDQNVWFDRLRGRAKERGLSRPLSERQIKKIIQAHKFIEIIEQTVERWNNCLVVDTAFENHRRELESIVKKWTTRI